MPIVAPGARLRPPRPSEPHDDPALSQLRADVARRIAGVCPELPPDEFARLVDRIARFKRRWQLREHAQHSGLLRGSAA